MDISTKAFGVCSIDPEEIVTFQNGMPGFEDVHQYILLGNGAEDTALMWLQSTENPDLAFVVARPETFRSEYKPKIKQAELKEIKLETAEDALVLVIAVVPEDVKKMTINLRAPLVINRRTKLAKQIVLEDENFSIREAVFESK